MSAVWGGAYGWRLAATMSLLARLSSHHLSFVSRHLSFVRYAVAGVAISVGYTLTVFVLVEKAGWPGPASASAISFVLWTPVSYFVHRDFTFRFAHRYRSAGIKYLVSFFLRLAASALVVAVAIDYFQLHYLVGALMNWIVLPMINYFVLKLWVFTAPELNEPQVQ